MYSSPLSRSSLTVGSLILSGALVAGGLAPAFADDDAAAAAAVVTVTPPSDILTLPAADGVRDTVTLGLTADAPTEVDVAIVATEGGDVLAQLAPVVLTDAQLSAPIAVDLSDAFPAGSVLVRTTPADGEAVYTPVTVGSGETVAASLSLSRSKIYTWSKATARTATATVSATDETGLTVPFTGRVTTQIGSTTRSISIASTTGAAASATISASSLPTGAGKVSATVSGNGGEQVTTASAALTVSTVAVTSTKLSASSTTIYPSKDGYRDSTRVSVSTKTTTGSSIAATGTVKVTRSGKTVKSWKLSSTKSWAATWDGRVSGKLVPGVYTVSVSIKGPQGTTKSSSTKVTVKKGKLVTKHYKKTVSASAVITKYDAYDPDSYCAKNYSAAGDIFCLGYEAGDEISVIAAGSVTVPASVVAGEKYGSAKVRLTMNVSSLYNWAGWGYQRRGADLTSVKTVKKGANVGSWVGLPSSTSKVDVVIGLAEYSFVGAKTFTVEYSYKAMTTKY